METNQAIAALTALGHPTRLAAFRLLVDRLLPLCKNRDRESSEEMGTEDVKRVRL